MKLINVKNLTKRYHTKSKEILALDNISLCFDKHKIISIIGPSGCGKSTILNIIAKLENVSEGIIENEENLTIGYMMQTDALLPWLNVYENASLGLTLSKKEDKEYVNSLLKRYELIDFINEYPSNLSGGMRQRLALIRTLAIKPNILLLDEPFSKLDINTKKIIIDDVYKIIKELNITTILITHDIEEAISLSDEIILLTKRPGKLKKIYNLEFDNSILPSQRKKTKEFDNFYNDIWSNIEYD